jgi:hypothetical protein
MAAMVEICFKEAQKTPETNRPPPLRRSSHPNNRPGPTRSYEERILKQLKKKTWLNGLIGEAAKPSINVWFYM